MRNKFRFNGETLSATLLHRPDGFRLQTDQRDVAIDLNALGDGEHVLRLDGRSQRLWLATQGDSIYVHLDGRSYILEGVDALEAAGGDAGAVSDVAKAPMPGTVISVAAAAGDRVEKKHTLMTIESMKMETAIKAWRDGVVKEIHYPAGATFERDAALVTLEAEGDGDE